MSQKVGRNNNKVYKVVLTGGPCGGKTTGQARLCTFFENLGWKVYRVPETATVLMGGGVKWTDMSDEQVFQFQFNLIRTMMQIETTFFELAASSSSNCLVICDRGIMDATAYLKPGQWEKMRTAENWETTDLRDIRYNQVIHMVSAARGAEEFYGTDDHVTRYEGVALARELDERASQAWVGHPYFDVIDNSTDFEHKVIRMIAAVCNRLGIDVSDRLHMDSRKRKFLVQTLPEENGAYMNGDLPAVCKRFPQFQDFIVIHDYLVTPESRMQARIRRRGQNVKWDSLKGKWDLDSGNWTYTHTIRRPEINKVSVETKMQISAKEYELLLAQRDKQHYSIYKKRRCFLWNNQYFQMDIYQQPCHPRCKGLVLLETYTTKEDDELKLPDFLDIVKEVTTDRTFSMYNLSMKDERERTDSACEREVESIPNGTVY